ncbi:MAG: hypothetical protein A3K61_04040 [Thaumarchaeota archaeon RBG_16_49_8]|nr:MAG: hypothetical protein A3K61_04040 [Thaumarchaeota archaeon RBG_16_49_8]
MRPSKLLYEEFDTREEREHLVSYLYRALLLIDVVVSFIGSVIAFTAFSSVQVLSNQALIGIAFGSNLFLTGVMASEFWSMRASRRWHTPAANPYSRQRLLLSLIGLSISDIAMIAFAIQIRFF